MRLVQANEQMLVYKFSPSLCEPSPFNLQSLSSVFRQRPKWGLTSLTYGHFLGFITLDIGQASVLLSGSTRDRQGPRRPSRSLFTPYTCVMGKSSGNTSIAREPLHVSTATRVDSPYYSHRHALIVLSSHGMVSQCPCVLRRTRFLPLTSRHHWRSPPRG